MIELRNDQLVFSFPEVHPEAQVNLEFQRTLRIPDDGKDYPLPPGLGRFPLRHVDDFPEVPASWREHGGVMLPMYQSEALWINFQAPYLARRGTSGYPFAVKIATGKINAVSGEAWTNGLHRPQDYLVVPTQPWLDGYCVEEGIIRQFVAMPLGSGYSAEEQLTGQAGHGGVQVIVYPMKAEVFERRFPVQASRRRIAADMDFCMSAPCARGAADMGLAPGGRMRQEIFDDPFDFSDWDTQHASRCFVHLCNSLVWRSITGADPPTVPPTAREYTNAGLPWFAYYGDGPAVGGSGILAGLKSVLGLSQEKKQQALPENASVTVDKVVPIRPHPHQVREGTF